LKSRIFLSFGAAAVLIVVCVLGLNANQTANTGNSATDELTRELSATEQEVEQLKQQLKNLDDKK
jgi:cell division protein FtsB